MTTRPPPGCRERGAAKQSRDTRKGTAHCAVPSVWNSQWPGRGRTVGKQPAQDTQDRSAGALDDAAPVTAGHVPPAHGRAAGARCPPGQTRTARPPPAGEQGPAVGHGTQAPECRQHKERRRPLWAPHALGFGPGHQPPAMRTRLGPSRPGCTAEGLTVPKPTGNSPHRSTVLRVPPDTSGGSRTPLKLLATPTQLWGPRLVGPISAPLVTRTQSVTIQKAVLTVTAHPAALGQPGSLPGSEVLACPQRALLIVGPALRGCPLDTGPHCHVPVLPTHSPGWQQDLDGALYGCRGEPPKCPVLVAWAHGPRTSQVCRPLAKMRVTNAP